MAAVHQFQNSKFGLQEVVDNRFCYPHALPRIRYDCEDGINKVRICCFAGRLYDVKNKSNQLLAPGDLLGTIHDGTASDHCPDIGYNTNLNGSVTFWFPPYNGIVGLPWPGLPADYQLLYGADGFLHEYYVTGVSVSWKYNCDTGKVTFFTKWADMLDILGLRLDCHARSIPYVGTVDVNPDWYTVNELAIPHDIGLDVCPENRFSVKLLLTCGVVHDCTPFSCFPLCLANTCGTDPTVNYGSLAGTVTGACSCLNGDFGILWNPLGNFFYGSIGDPFGVNCFFMEVWYKCVGGTLSRRVKIVKDGITIIDSTVNVSMICDASGNVADTVTLSSSAFTSPLCSGYAGVILDVYTLN